MDKLTSAQLSEWEAYDRIDPIGSWRDDYRMASLSALMTNIVQAIYHEKGTEVKQNNPVDFMPIWDEAERKKIAEREQKEEVKRQSAEEMKSALLDFAKKHNEREALKKRKPTIVKK